MVSAFFANNVQLGNDTYEKLQESESDAVQKLRNEAIYLYLRYKRGNSDALEKLHNLADRVSTTPEALPTVYNFLGAAYELANNFSRAGEVYEIGVEKASTEEGRSDLVVSAARCLFAVGNQNDAFNRVMVEIGKIKSRPALAILYNGLASLYQSGDNYELRAIALEKAIEYSPNDNDMRFGAGYSYGEKDLDALSILHYKTLLEFEPANAMALNNIGVQYVELKMPIRGITSYKKAFKEQNTLSAANLAYAYLNAGFADEATQILDEAKQVKDLHRNVGSAIAAVATQREEEEKTDKEIVRAGREQQRFLQSFANAYFTYAVITTEFDGTWWLPNGIEVTAIHNENKLELKWRREDRDYTMVADKQNRAARITKYESRKDYYSSSLADKGYAYLSHDNREILIMLLNDHKHSFLTLQRSETTQ